MLQSISWYEFIRIILIAAVFYYVIIAGYFYKKDIASLFQQQKAEIGLGVNISTRTHSESRSSEESNEEVHFTAVHELLEDLKLLFEKASETKMVKNELLQAICSKLNVYPGIKGTDLVDDINIHIREEIKEICCLDILPEDLKRIWNS